MLFDRMASVTIGSANDSSAIVYEDFRIAFKVTKTIEEEPNVAEITIYNTIKGLADGTDARDKIVILRAGYRDSAGLQIIFIGKVVTAKYSTDRPDSSLIITAADGLEALLGAKFAKTYGEGTSAKNILKDSLSSTGLPVEMPDIDEENDAEYTQGFATNGTSLSSARNVAKKLKLRWTLVDGVIYVTSLNNIRSNEQSLAPLIDSTTGLIGSPVQISTSDKGKESGWSYNSLLYAGINPSSIINLSDKGSFRVHKLIHEGDTHTGDFKTSVEVYI